MFGSPRPSAALVFASFLLPCFALPVLAGCKNDARDAQCTPEGPDHASNPECHYAGQGRGPLVTESACPPVEGEVPAICPSFYDVLDVLVDPARGNCTSLGCHGSEILAQSNIFLPIGDAQAFYDGLTDAHGSVGRPYVVPDDPDSAENEAENSWIVCNLLGEKGGGFPMPPPAGLPDPTDVEIVREWILCGAPEPEPCLEDDDDSACVACAKTGCCGPIQQCLDDAECSTCVTCAQTSGDLSACEAECGVDNARVEALLGCLGALCEDECPGAG